MTSILKKEIQKFSIIAENAKIQMSLLPNGDYIPTEGTTDKRLTPTTLNSFQFIDEDNLTDLILNEYEEYYMEEPSIQEYYNINNQPKKLL